MDSIINRLLIHISIVRISFVLGGSSVVVLEDGLDERSEDLESNLESRIESRLI